MSPVFLRRFVSMLSLASRACLVWAITQAASPPTVAVRTHSLDSFVESIPLAPPTHSRDPGPVFRLLAGFETGIEVVHRFPTNAPFALLQDQGGAAGLCVGDYDSDGWPDLFVANYNRGNRLYRNLGHWRFEDVTARANVGGNGRWCGGSTFVDIDNDGDLDLFVCVFNAPNLLYVNQGNGTFQEQARAFGLDFQGASVMMAFADYDRDGRLDGYLVTHRLTIGPDDRLPRSSQEAIDRALIRRDASGRVEITERYRELFVMLDKGGGRIELAIAGQRDRLYRGRSDGRFEETTTSAGIAGNDIGLAAIWWDFNDDGWPDVYVSNDYRGPDRLYVNQKNGTFLESAATTLPHVPWSSMGLDIADVNNDGRMDLLATEMAGTTHARRMLIGEVDPEDRWFLELSRPKQYLRNALYLSTGTDRVFEAAHLAGLAATDWTWSPKFADFDNDGRVDVFVANGMARDFIDGDLLPRMKQRNSPGWRNAPLLREENLAFRNLGDLRFERVGPRWGLDARTASYCAATADFDRDGDLDLVVMNLDDPISIYRNDSTNGERVVIRLRGTQSHSMSVGATVRLHNSTGIQTRQLALNSGFMSANEPIVHFGLGDAHRIERLEIDWPSGQHQTLTNLATGRFYTITESSRVSDTLKRQPTSQHPWFSEADSWSTARHQESSYDDFAREPLLPWRLSRLGPGLALGDIDGDGDEDLWMGGAAGQSGVLWLQAAPGQFRLATPVCFDEDRACEDMGALLFDLEGDGDLDLYVVSGGVECEPDAPVLCDRLYLNDGRGHFNKAPEGVIPEDRDAGSVVVSADFDRDGGLDLFVGGRGVPGRYPLPGRNRLLRNVGGRFVDVTDMLANGLPQTGMVTSALWSDANDDGWLDLLIAHEWGPVRLFENQNGKLVEMTQPAGLDSALGFWHGIAAGDVDEDGDIDYVVTNYGLNTPYQASTERPALAYYGDFDGQGERHFVEAYFEADRLLPARGRDALKVAMPLLGERFPSFRGYAAASLDEIVESTQLDAALQVRVTTLESGVFLNDGQARFRFMPLPRLAQIAPAFGVVIEDLDADGHLDLVLAQNFFGSRPGLGRMDGGLGLVLRGHGDGTFVPVWPKESGFLVPSDAKAIVPTDLNGDGWTDLVVSVNDDEPKRFDRAAPALGPPFRVQLRGEPGHANTIGARVQLLGSDGRVRVAEVYGGSGYLSQSGTGMRFGLPDGVSAREVRVRWPDGQRSAASVPAEARTLTLRPPSRIESPPVSK